VLKPVIFKANDIRGVTEGDEPEWDEAGAHALGGAFVEVFGLAGRSIVLGRDMRLSGPRMSAAFVEAVLDAGVDVVDVGLASPE
jgi:phosphomannomutase